MEIKIYTYNLETLGDWLEEYQWRHGWTSATKVLNSQPYLKADDMESLPIFFHERVPQVPGEADHCCSSLFWPFPFTDWWSVPYSNHLILLLKCIFP